MAIEFCAQGHLLPMGRKICPRCGSGPTDMSAPPPIPAPRAVDVPVDGSVTAAPKGDGPSPPPQRQGLPTRFIALTVVLLALVVAATFWALRSDDSTSAAPPPSQARPTTTQSPTTGESAPPATNDPARADLFNAAGAEELYRAAHDRYAAKLADLEAEGFTPTPGTVITIAVEAAFGSRFCAVASSGAGDNWWLYDGPIFGLHETPFPTAAGAEANCSIAHAEFPAPSAG